MNRPPDSFFQRAQNTTASFRDEFPFEPRGFSAPAGNLHFIDEGEGDAPLLCVHGNPTWSFYFRRIVAEFKGNQRVVAVDHLGCGLSDKPQDWSYRLDDHIRNLEALVLDLDLTNITLVLHDWGGAIGMGFATRHPERIGRIILGNTAAFPASRMPWRIAASRLPLIGRLLLRGFGAFSRIATTSAVERKLSPAAKRGLLAPYDSWHNRIAQWMFVKDIPMSPAHPSFATLQAIDDNLHKLAALPMAICWGMGDWCFSPDYIDRWLERFPEAKVKRVETAGHYLLEDEPQIALDFYRDFLDSVS